MKKTSVFWIGEELGFKWAQKELLSVDTTYLKNPDVGLTEIYQNNKNNLMTEIYLVFDVERISIHHIEYYAKKFLDVKNIKLVFLFNDTETPSVSHIKHFSNIYFIHRYDSHALKGCIINLVYESTMFLRQEERRKVNKIIKLKRSWEPRWHDVHLRDTSKSGLGVIVGFGDNQFLRVRDRVVVRVNDHLGMAIYFLAEVKRVMHNSTSLTAGFRILKPLSHSDAVIG